MREAYSLVWSVLVLFFRSRISLEAEILILRYQLNIQRRHLPKRLAFSAMDRLIFVRLYRLAPNTIKALTIVKPNTVIRWHRAGFSFYWRWKSRHRCGRPTVPLEIRRLIREMSIANPLWGAPRIHGELLKLGIEISQTSVAKYMARRRACACRKPIGWRLTENRAMLISNERSCRAHCVGGCRSVSVAGSDRGRDRNVAAADHCSATNCPQ
jgi:hypothetical protein